MSKCKGCRKQEATECWGGPRLYGSSTYEGCYEDRTKPRPQANCNARSSCVNRSGPLCSGRRRWDEDNCYQGEKYETKSSLVNDILGWLRRGEPWEY